MKNNLINLNKTLPVMQNKQLNLAKSAENHIRDNLNRVKCVTQHTIHDGIYSRTLFMPKGSVVAGVVIQLPTTLILSGKMLVYVGDDIIKVDGYQVIPTMGNRKQVVKAVEDSYATLLFKTDAKTVEEAEIEMTYEYENLQSRCNDSLNIVTITGV